MAHAARNGHSKCLKTLVEAKADVEVATRDQGQIIFRPAFQTRSKKRDQWFSTVITTWSPTSCVSELVSFWDLQMCVQAGQLSVNAAEGSA